VVKQKLMGYKGVSKNRAVHIVGLHLTRESVMVLDLEY